MEWHPDYYEIKKYRQRQYQCTIKNLSLIEGSKTYYKTRPIEFIENWGNTYDPRNAGTDLPTLMPFILFSRQREFIQFLYECFTDQEHGAIEKCRDVGATWCAVAFSVWLWQYHPGSSIGWGSRKEQLVDRIGDPDSIFEKIRIFINNLPSFCKPVGYDPKAHASYMKVINPETGATITGESGDNIGRGGRKAIYFKDESAHYEHAENIEAALGDNTNVQIDISSVNGPETIFQRKIDTGVIWEGQNIKSGETRVFEFDWRDHPLKTQEWYDKRRDKAIREGLLHKFAQEVDRDASAAVKGTLIKAQWIDAAIDAHKKLGIEIEGGIFASLDVADEGGDNHALGIRKGILVNHVDAWNLGDVGKATRKALLKCILEKVGNLSYDSIGVGAGVKSEINRIKENADGENAIMFKEYLDKTVISPWNASAGVLNPDERYVKDDDSSPINKELFYNLKAQGWWNLRNRFEKTYKAVNGEQYEDNELISIDSECGEIADIRKQLTQIRYNAENSTGKIKIEKKPDGARSPNKADVMMMMFHPVDVEKVFPRIRWI
jgi:phage terminase large subunit